MKLCILSQSFNGVTGFGDIKKNSCKGGGCTPPTTLLAPLASCTLEWFY